MSPPESLKENLLTKKITNKKGIIDFLEYCQHTHQLYIDNPHWRRGNVGKKLHHENCVARYNEAINLIKKGVRKNERIKGTNKK